MTGPEDVLCTPFRADLSVSLLDSGVNVSGVVGEDPLVGAPRRCLQTNRTPWNRES